MTNTPHTSRLRFHFALLSFAVLLSCLASPLRAADDKLNFLFILADDLGYMDVGFNNAKTFYETPNLDLLAASGMVFTDFYAACQVCSPTRASILTGKYPARTDTTNFFSGRRAGKFLPADFETQMATEEITVAEALKEHNYRTFFAGKWHLGGQGHAPTDQGFDINKGGGENGLPRSYFSPYRNVTNLPAGPEGEFLTDRLASESVDFLNSVKQDPFLLYLSFYSVHTPLQAPKNLVAKYEAKAKKMGRSDEAGRWGVDRCGGAPSRGGFRRGPGYRDRRHLSRSRRRGLEKWGRRRGHCRSGNGGRRRRGPGEAATRPVGQRLDLSSPRIAVTARKDPSTDLRLRRPA